MDVVQRIAGVIGAGGDHVECLGRQRLVQRAMVPNVVTVGYKAAGRMASGG